jgi:hypothetical protein
MHDVSLRFNLNYIITLLHKRFATLIDDGPEGVLEGDPAPRARQR